MKKIAVIILVLCMLSMVTPASAAHYSHETGTRLNLMDTTPNLVYPANTPFWDFHGWYGLTPGTQAIGIVDFQMEINGSSARPGVRYDASNKQAGCEKFCVGTQYDFPNGLPAGTYTFTGNWIVPCQYGDNPSECSTPNQAIIISTVTTIITFK